MPRSARKYSNSKVYHIILKGIDSQNIFYDDSDRIHLKKQLANVKKVFDYTIYAYCLMSNHIHLVIKVEDILLSKVIHSLAVRYSLYFNSKYKRKGPLFQNRFNSKEVENYVYFLALCRYVHRNPENAGIAKTQDYEWSSYKEYVEKSTLIKKETLLHYLKTKSIDEFINYTITEGTEFNDYNDVDNFAEYELIKKLSDTDVANIIIKKFNLNSINEIATFFKNRTDSDLQKDILIMKKILGTNKTQIGRIIRINKKCINKFWNGTQKGPSQNGPNGHT